MSDLYFIQLSPKFEMTYIKIRNKKGTGGDTPPRGYSSWLEYWEKNKNKKATLCEAKLCYNPADVGGHVIKSGMGSEEYILPICHKCNSRSEEEEFEAWNNDLVPVISNLVAHEN
jgi:hypothetical protein